MTIDIPTLIKTNLHFDRRGSFKKIFEKSSKFKFNINQVNLSSNLKKGTLRGMHAQNKPYNDSKIVVCVCGEVFDVVIDVRKKSKNYKKKYYFRLRPNDDSILYIPSGFLHGFQTMLPNTVLLYLHNKNYFSKKSLTVNPIDKTLSIKWPINKKILSDNDKNGFLFEYFISQYDL